MKKEFWRGWKRKTKIEQAGIKSLKQAKKIILEHVPKNKIVSICVGGSFVRREMTKKSDIDIWTITKDMKSQKIISKISKRYGGKYDPKIGFNGYSLWELKTGKHSKQITKLRTGPKRFVKNINNLNTVYGKRLSQEGFPTKSDLEDLRILIKTFSSKFLPLYEKKKIGFQDVLKQVFWMTSLEQKLKINKNPHSFKGIARSVKDKSHIVHEALRLRLHPTKDKKIRRKFMTKLKSHLKHLEKTIK